MALQGVEVPADKLGQRGSRDGHQEVRWAIVPMKQGNACGGKGPG